MPSPESQQRALYAGNDLDLLKSLRSSLERDDRAVVRCADAMTARILIKSENRYALLLLDAELPDAIGEELAAFARSLPHREHTPLIFVRASVDFESLAKVVVRQLDASARRAPRVVLQFNLERWRD
jgi:CheY-like chemotaxis protein